jgi:hypothetical protein
MIRDVNLYQALPREMRPYNYVRADLRQFTLDFVTLDVRRVPILYGGISWTPMAETVWPGAKGWLPD